jgi:hypothetical protein
LNEKKLNPNMKASNQQQAINRKQSTASNQQQAINSKQSTSNQ